MYLNVSSSAPLSRACVRSSIQLHKHTHTHTHSLTRTHTRIRNSVLKCRNCCCKLFTSLYVSLSSSYCHKFSTQTKVSQIAKHTHTIYQKQYKYILEKYQSKSNLSVESRPASFVHFVNVSHKCAKFSPLVVCVCVYTIKVPKAPHTTTIATTTTENTSMYIEHQ